MGMCCPPVVCWCTYCVIHTHTRLTALFPGLRRWDGTRNSVMHELCWVHYCYQSADTERSADSWKYRTSSPGISHSGLCLFISIEEPMYRELQYYILLQYSSSSGVWWWMKKGWGIWVILIGWVCGFVFFSVVTLLDRWHKEHLVHKKTCGFSSTGVGRKPGELIVFACQSRNRQLL